MCTMYVYVLWRSCCVFFFFFKQKTAYEVRISDWSSDVCSSDLAIDAADRHDLPRSRIRDVSNSDALIGRVLFAGSSWSPLDDCCGLNPVRPILRAGLPAGRVQPHDATITLDR